MSAIYYRPDGSEVTDTELADEFEEWLDEIYDPYEVGYLTVYAGEVTRQMDPIAFRVGLSDYIDARMSDGELFEDPLDEEELHYDHDHQ